MPAPTAYTLTGSVRETRHATLFRGRREADQHPVLLKVIAEDAPSALDTVRLEHEHALLDGMDVPGIVKTLGLTKIGERTALVLEDAGDRSLEDALGGTGLDLPHFLDTSIAMAEILESVHRQRIIHQDIKPQHFFRKGESGPLTLIDFGAAMRVSVDEQGMTSVAQPEGTLAYMSPEQTGRMNRVVDRRTDLYSLGVSYYQLLTGVLPFQSSDTLGLVHSHIARLPMAPHEVISSVPPVLSAIILKLLSKNAEDRYQDVAGLKADLEICRERLRTHGGIDDFPIGERDFSGQLRISTTLYGRQPGILALFAAFNRVRNGSSELLLVSGYSGIGKSALVNETCKQIAGEAHFAAGKFDQFAGNAPYAALSHACGDLVRSLLTESAEAITVWRQKLLGILGANGKVVADLVPELELVIGPQLEVQDLGPNESQHRFERTFQEFLGVFASERRPLVLFVDDLQWADPASLRLLQLMLTDRRRGHLLIIGAYRDNEVGAAHPLTLALTDLGTSGGVVNEVALQPLDIEDVTHLIADTLRCPLERAAPLSEVVLAKTGGNPFFLSQFLTTLHADGQLSFDPLTRRWVWDLAGIERSVATDNVVELVLAKLKRFTSDSREVLWLAACIGHEFDRQTLATIAELPPERVSERLEEALREGLVLPFATVTTANPRYRFLHDRVQQAAYSLIDESAKEATHLRIGRLMMWGLDTGATEPLFAVVNHMNIGAGLITDPFERLALARMNIEAARRARDAAAHAVAEKLLATALELFGEDVWNVDYELAHAGHLLKAECAYGTHQIDEAFRLIESIEVHSRTSLDRVRARDLKTRILTSLNRLEEAISHGIATACLLGCDLPTAPGELDAAIGAEMAALGAALADRSVESLIDLPVMTDEKALARINTLYQIIPAATQLRPQIMVLAVAKAVNLALTGGNGPVSSYFYVCYGMVLAVSGDYETGYRLGQVGIALNDRHKHHAVDGANHFVFAAFVAAWRNDLSECVSHLRIGLKASLEAGDHLHAAYCASFHVLYRFFRGERFDDVATDLEWFSELVEQMGDVVNLRELRMLGRLIEDLTDRPADEPGSDTGCEPWEAIEAGIGDSGNRFLISSHRLFRAISAYLLGDIASAAGHIEIANAVAVPGNFISPEARFYQALIRAAQLRSEPGCDRTALVAALESDESTFRAWAHASPTTFAHRHALVAAELAACQGRSADAQSLYDLAIAKAEAVGSIALIALANELAAHFHLALGRTKISRPYFGDAHAAYLRWGATNKAKDIAARVEVESRWTAANETRIDQLDALALIKASQAISTQIVLPELVDTLMWTMIEQAGAQRGYLILVRNGKFWLEGVVGTTTEATNFKPFEIDWTDESIHELLPASILLFVSRAKEKVLLNDAEKNNAFSADRYFVNHHPRSLLCLPMLRRASLVGLLYLENRLAGDALNDAHVGILEVLSAQAAISIENATLYDDMERRVEDRTRRLEQSTKELEASLRLISENQAQLIEAERKAAVAHYEGELAIARQIQTSILPQTPQIEGFEIATAMVTASEVGGDYFDLLPAEAGGCWIGIGDVSGHGLDAGLMMLMVQSGLGALMRQDAVNDPARLVCHLNRMLHDNVRVRLRRDDFATLTLFRFFRDGRFVFAGAHEDILIWRAATRRVEQVPTPGTWVGATSDVERDMPNGENCLADGDVMLLYTDGITEARSSDGEPFGMERFAALLDTLSSAPAADICARVLAAIDAWAPQREDDRTLIALRRGPCLVGRTQREQA